MHNRCLIMVVLYIIQVFCQNDDNLAADVPTRITSQTKQENGDDFNLDPSIYVVSQLAVTASSGGRANALAPRTPLKCLVLDLIEDVDSQLSDASNWLNMVLSESLNNKFNDSKPSGTGKKDECTTNDNKVGKCVPYYQCDPNHRTIIEDGRTIIDFNSKLASCPHYLQVCCILDSLIDHVGDTSSNQTANLHTQSDSGKVLNKDSFGEETNKCGWNNHALNIFRPNNKEIADNSPYANYGDFPWMIALIRKLSESAVWSRKDYLGGGSLIQPGVVLTVAHKVKEIAAKDLKCRAGEWDTQTTFELFAHQERDVEKIIIHPQYFRPSLYNDIGLLFLKSPFDLKQSPNIGLACVGSSLPPPGTECFSMGWGKEFKEKNKYAVILKKVRVPLVSASDCQGLLRKTRLGRFFVLHKSLTCAGGQVGVDTCLRDGGSSLVCPVQTLGESTRFVIFGMVAYGIHCGIKDSPGVYVNVPHLKSWLDTTIENDGYNSTLYTYSE